MSSSISNSISGGISFSGIGSGTDFTSIIEQLKSIEEIPKTRYTLWQGEWEYRTAAMEEVLTIMSESKTTLQGFTSPAELMEVAVESSEEEVATASISLNSDLTSGNYSIDVKQIARPSMFSTKTIFPEKNSAINTSDETQYFEYTYQGTTRSISAPPGTTLDQLVMRINNDAQNPGVTATLIKNGDGYMFQIQGDDTGVKSELSISSNIDSFSSQTLLFTGQDVSVNNTGSTQAFSLVYGSKTLNMDIADNMTAGEFVDAFNSHADNPGLTASLELSGNDYKIIYKSKSSGYEVYPPVTTNLSALGGGDGFASADAVVNNTGTLQSLSYTYLGKSYSINVANGQTLQDVADQINSNPANTVDGKQLVTASVVEKDGKFFLDFQSEDAEFLPEGSGDKVVKYKVGEGQTEYSFDVEEGTSVKEYVTLFNTAAKSMGTGVTAELVEDGSGNASIKYYEEDASGNQVDITSSIELTSDIAGIDGSTPFALVSGSVTVGTSSNMDGLGKKATISGKDTILNTSGSSQDFNFSHNGTDYSYSIADGTTLQEFVDGFNSSSASGLEAQIVDKPSGYELIFVDSSGNTVVPENVNTPVSALQIGGDNWYEQESQDAVFTVNGWPLEMTSDSNTLSEVINGMVITIKSEGETQLSVVSDYTAMVDNIYEIVDAINMIKGTIIKLSEVDEDKDVGSPDEEGLSSQFTWQTGSALTGNYGVQLLLSNFNSITSSSAYGFTRMQNPEDTLSDLYTAFSQIGISTSTNEGSEDFGLLVVDEAELKAAIEKDPLAVAELFSAQSVGSTTSQDFTVASTGLFATAGSYDVEYTVNDAGVVTQVYINGALAQTDSSFPGRYTVGDQDNAALGLSVQFNTGGLTPGSHTGSVQVKQGKVNELIAFLDDELRSTDVEGEEQGTLPTIISNYADIIDNIQTKIDKETDRIARWEENQKLYYARLEETLANYEATTDIMASLMPQTTTS